ncbi:MAG TPA: DUF411 domain-containing protein [Ilumatobacteraceae bacterium]|nr:DUF411 domain-containing protein [Ilumatobacteraceae bacterium]
MTEIARRQFCAGFGVAIVGLVGASLAGCTGASEASTPAETSGVAELAGLSVQVRRDPGCSCCTEWVVYLRSRGATVDEAEDPERAAFRASRGIPDSAASCHTAVVEGYAVEGHVPAEAIRKLLTDHSDVAGLALPGMPADSPGMGGGASTWANQQVVLVNRDGSLTAFAY